MLDFDCGLFGQFTKDDYEVFKTIFPKVKGNVFAEIGCWAGRSTSYIAEEAKKRNGRVKVIDWFKGNIGSEPSIEAAKNINVFEVFKSNMLELGLWDCIDVYNMTSEEAVKQIPDKSLEFLFMDGNHIYEFFSKDLQAYLPKMKDGSIMSGHDWDSPGYSNDFLGYDWYDGKHHGVVKAVTEIFGNNETLRTRDLPKQEKSTIWYVTV